MITEPRGISRKQFLRAALGATAGVLLVPDHIAGASTGSESGEVPTPPRTAGTTQHVLNLPADVRVRGANIVCSGYPLGSFYRELAPNVWGAMWRAWEWDDWIAPQISDCASLGNAARLWGDTEVVSAGLITRDVYLARWQQMLDYAAANGLYVFACGGGRGDFTHVDAQKLFRPWTQLLASYPNVLGVDVLNESWGNPAYYKYDYSDDVALVRSLTDITRSAGLPATSSFPMAKPEWWNWDSAQPVYQKNPVAPYWEVSDYIDIHVYAKATPAQIAATSKFPWAKGKPIMFGEFGISTTEAGPTERTECYESIKKLVASTPINVGALAWSTYDVNNKKNACGLFAAPGQPREEMTSVLAGFPIIR